MAEIVSAKGTGHKVESIIQHAQKEIVLISPYLRVDTIYMQELQLALRRKVTVKFVCRQEDLKDKESEKLLALPGIKVFGLPRLHAKCYYNESAMVITSMNLHESSEVNNREIGIYLDRAEDKKLYADALTQASSILDSATPYVPAKSFGRDVEPRVYAHPPQKQTDLKAFVSRVKTSFLDGHCIRCADGIQLNPDRPFCRDCYEEWAQWENEDYEESYCHQCGKERATSFAKPLCRSCYSKG